MNTLISPQRASNPSDLARQKINRALQLLETTRHDNTELRDSFTSSEPHFQGYEPHVKAIEFDRPSRDVSEHGTALKEKSESAQASIANGDDELLSVTEKTDRMLELIASAKTDIEKSNRTAYWRLDTAESDLEFVKDSDLPGLQRSSRRSKSLLNDELGPYLTEVEADEPGRDVGRFADDIEEIWGLAYREARHGPIYANSAERQFTSAEAYLVRAREALN